MSRLLRRLGIRRAVFWTVLALLAAFVLFIQFVVDSGGSAKDFGPAMIVQYPAATELPAAEVLAVVDGDTIDVALDDDRVRVHYYGAEAPAESGECAQEAQLRNRQVVEGTTVRLLTPTVGEAEDEQGALHRYVFNEGGLSIEGLLINEGMLAARRNQGQFAAEFLALERSALAKAAGCLWRH